VGSWLTWCADKKNWTAPALPGGGTGAPRRRRPPDRDLAALRASLRNRPAAYQPRYAAEPSGHVLIRNAPVPAPELPTSADTQDCA
jgi:hypothetical protein